MKSMKNWLLISILVAAVFIQPGRLFAATQCVQAGTIGYSINPQSVSGVGTSMSAVINFVSTQVNQDSYCADVQSVNVTFYFKSSSGSLLGQQMWAGPTISSGPNAFGVNINQNVSYGNTYSFTLGTFNLTRSSLGNSASFTSYVQITDANSGNQITQSSPITVTYTPPSSSGTGSTTSGCMLYTTQSACESAGCKWSSGDINTPPTCAAGSSGTGGTTSGSTTSGGQSNSPGGGTLPNPISGCNDLSCVGQKIIAFLQTIAFVILSIMVLYGGFQMMTAGGSEEQFTNGRKTLTYAVIGIAVVIIASGVAGIVKSLLGG